MAGCVAKFFGGPFPDDTGILGGAIMIQVTLHSLMALLYPSQMQTTSSLSLVVVSFVHLLNRGVHCAGVQGG